MTRTISLFILMASLLAANAAAQTTERLSIRGKSQTLHHGVPNEPTFSTRELAARVAPAPLAVINSTHDEFVSSDEVARIVAAAANPKRLWMIDAADHRFSNQPDELNRRLLEAIDWIRQNAPGK